MYRDKGVNASYEDAIPVKRSKRSVRTRNELRMESETANKDVEFALAKNISDKSVKEDTKEYVVSESISDKLKTLSRASRKSEISNDSNVASSEKKVAKKIYPPVKIGDTTEEDTATEVEEIKDEQTDVECACEDVKEDVIETNSEDINSVDIVDTETLEENVLEIIEEIEETDDPEIVEESDETEDDTDGDDSSETEEFEDESEDEVEEDLWEPVQGVLTVTRNSSEIAAAALKWRKYYKLTFGKVVRRFFLSVFTTILLVAITLFTGLAVVAHGPSETIRDALVLSALQASATKWVPGLFLSDEVVDQILADSQKVSEDIISIDDYSEQQKEEVVEDKWANAIDGMLYESVKGPTFKGYVLLVKDPSRISVGIANEYFSEGTVGMRIFDIADKYGAVAAINGGEYPDAGGMGDGGRPIGITYSGGRCVWSDGLRRSFMGFDSNNRLICREGLTKAQAEALGIRDGVCFQTGRTLITNDNGNVTLHYANNNTGTAQRSAIGQTADGTVILLVTDGRTASSLGATHNDVIDIMVSYGAISAGMLDGGSSSLMYYRDFYDKYGLDKTNLDEYQKKGLINRYVAFTNPRRIPTCFIVAPE